MGGLGVDAGGVCGRTSERKKEKDKPVSYCYLAQHRFLEEKWFTARLVFMIFLKVRECAFGCL